MTEILFLLMLLSGKEVSGSLPDTDVIHTMIQGRRLTIATHDIQKLEPVRDAGGSITWPVPGFLMVRVTYVDQSEGILPIQNFRFPTAGLSGDVLLSDVTSAVRASAAGGMIRLTSDVLTRHDSSEQLGEILNQLFEVRVFYNSVYSEGVILRFGRDQLRRIEFGDTPLEVKTEAPPAQAAFPQTSLPTQQGTAPQAGQATPANPIPQIIKVPVRPRYDRIFLRNGDRLTGELLGPGLDFKVLTTGTTSAAPSSALPDPKLAGLNRKLIALSELKAIDFATQSPNNSRIP